NRFNPNPDPGTYNSPTGGLYPSVPKNTKAVKNQHGKSFLMHPGANLRGVDLRQVDLTDANLAGADLTGVDLWRADLTRANLTGANLTGANLTGANLNSALYDDKTRWPSGFSPEKQGARKL
ncbi:MAG: pentapeptide repeat-containing protein, partial [Burkholderiales bacterium]